MTAEKHAREIVLHINEHSMEVGKMKIAAAMKRYANERLELAAVKMAGGSDGVHGDWEAKEATEAIRALKEPV